jgi:fatty acid CoA ligase FadD21
VKISDRNLAANFEQLMADYFPDLGGVAPTDTTIVSWLPFYHDMGLMLAVIAPILGGYRAEIMSPVAFLQRPARWVQALASNTHAYSAGPNFAFELAVRKTSDEEMAGLDLGGVLTLVSGAERVHPATLDRFVERFAPFGFRHDMMTPSTAWPRPPCTSRRATGGAPVVVDFDPEKLAAAPPSGARAGRQPAISGVPKSPTVRIVDPDTRNAPRERSARSGCTARTSRAATGTSPRRRGARSAQCSSLHRQAHLTDHGCEPETWVSCSKVSCSSWAASRIC